jgi:hypothetical protein
MYRYGDGTPFPLDENFIETLTTAVETCTNAFMPLTELDGRRERAKDARKAAERELARMAEFDKALNAALAPFVTADKKPDSVTGIAQKVAAAAKQAVQQAHTTVEGRVAAMEAQAAPRTAADSVLSALRPFFDAHQLPKAQWIMSWDVRGNEPHANAVATGGRLVATFELAAEPYRTPIRVDSLAEGVIVHMMRKGVFGKAKPAPIELGKYVLVAYERTNSGEHVLTLRESATKAAPGIRFAVSDKDATWVTISVTGDADGEQNPLDLEDLDGVRRLGDRAYAALKDLIVRRQLVDLTLNGDRLDDMPEPRVVPLELLAQLTPLARTIRERSRMSGELVLKRDIGDGRREELYVPRAQLAQQFARLPAEYRRPFEDMGINTEDTQPAIQLPRPPAKPSSAPAIPPDAKTIEIKNS